MCENVTGETTQCGKFSTTIGRTLPDRKLLQALDNWITHILSCQSKVTVLTCFVYKVIMDL